MSRNKKAILARLDELSPQELKRYLVQELTQKKLGLTWETDLIERDKALNSDLVFPKVFSESSHWPEQSASNNLIIEGDNFDSLRLLRSTHRGRIKAIYIDPPYNTGTKDWIYNDHFMQASDRFRHSAWLEFLYQRLSIARDLLTPDGVIMVSINDEGRSKLELLMDEVMPGRRIGSFVWRCRTGGNDTKGAFLSTNHEHVLVYGNAGFRFSGEEKSYSMYRYEDERGIFRLSDLTKAHTVAERPNTFYPIHDPVTDIYYPCSPSRVWAYASKHKVKPGSNIRGKVIEDMISAGDIWFPPEQRVELFETKADLMHAIEHNDIPYSGKTPLITAEPRDLEFWVGKKIGYGRPALKKYKDGLKNETQPLSSWLTPRQESDTASPDKNMPIVGATEEGSKSLRDLMGRNAFPYPKPPSLIAALLEQATSSDDIVLDFFAGSGTTAQVVLDLNAKDGGQRRFILCSSTEATAKEPDKNLCRDVCAERVRRAMAGYGDTPGLGGDFTYMKMDKVEEADLLFEAEPRHAFGLLSLRETGYLSEPPVDQPVWIVARTSSSAIALCPSLCDEAVEALNALPVSQLIVYSDRPDSLQEALAMDKSVTCYSMESALRYAQGGNRASSPKVQAENVHSDELEAVQ